MTRKIKAVLFDIGGTLEYLSTDRETRHRMYVRLYESLKENGIDIDLYELIHAVKTGFRKYKKWRVKEMREAEPEKIWLDYIFDKVQIDEQKIRNLSSRLCEIYEAGYYEREMRRDVSATLEALKAMGLKLGCVSNAISPFIEHNLERYGIRHYFDVVVLSCDFGRRKPHPAIFKEALSLLNVKAKESVFVGDTVSRDIIGAKKAGFKYAILIRSISTEDNLTVQRTKPDFIIDNLSEILKLLQDSPKLLD